MVGSGGAGKSTFSRRLGELTGLPIVHLDEHFWHPGWVDTPRDEWRRVQSRLLAGDAWIADGNYGGTLDVRLAWADTVIVLALSRTVCTVRVLRRWLRHHGRAVQAPGCPERVSGEFLRWVWTYPTGGRARLDAALAGHRDHLRVIELTSPRRVAAFLREVELGPPS